MKKGEKNICAIRFEPQCGRCNSKRHEFRVEQGEIVRDIATVNICLNFGSKKSWTTPNWFGNMFHPRPDDVIPYLVGLSLCRSKLTLTMQLRPGTTFTVPYEESCTPTDSS
jgi:hypothetical protein